MLWVELGTAKRIRIILKSCSSYSQQGQTTTSMWKPIPSKPEDNLGDTCMNSWVWKFINYKSRSKRTLSLCLNSCNALRILTRQHSRHATSISDQSECFSITMQSVTEKNAIIVAVSILRINQRMLACYFHKNAYYWIQIFILWHWWLDVTVFQRIPLVALPVTGILVIEFKKLASFSLGITRLWWQFLLDRQFQIYQL